MGVPNQAVAEEHGRLPSFEQLSGTYLYTAEDLQPVASIDLEPIRPATRANALGGVAAGTNVMMVAVYVSEQAEGSISPESFDEILNDAAQATYDTDELFEVMDRIEEQHPRVTQLLDRVRGESWYGAETFVDISKASWVLTAFRHAKQSGQ